MLCTVLSAYEERGGETTRGRIDDWTGEGKVDLITERSRDAGGVVTLDVYFFFLHSFNDNLV